MVSHFRMLRENGRTKENFEASVGHYSVLRNASSYAANLAHLFSLFPREQVHLAIYEEIFADPDAASGYLTSLQNFLGVLPHDGQAAAGKTKVRETMGAPRSDWLIKRAKKTRRWLRQYDLEWVVSAAARIGIDRRLFLKKRRHGSDPSPGSFTALWRNGRRYGLCRNVAGAGHSGLARGVYKLNQTVTRATGGTTSRCRPTRTRSFHRVLRSEHEHAPFPGL